MRRIPDVCSIAGLLLLAAIPAHGAEAVEFTEEFRLADCSFSDSGRNPYFSLQPGDQLVLEGEDDGETLVVQITVLRDRQSITFETEDGARRTVRTRVIEEREWVDDELVEVSRNFFARCVRRTTSSTSARTWTSTTAA